MEQSTAVAPAFKPAITWLNYSGDLTVSWDPENEAAMLALIEAKMKERYSFFITKPRFLGLFGSTSVKAENIDQVRKAGAVTVEVGVLTGAKPKLHDEALEAVVQSGAAHLVKPEAVRKEFVRRATSAQEVVKHQTLALKPVVGG